MTTMAVGQDELRLTETLDAALRPTCSARIDLNVRVRGNQTFVGFEDIDGPYAVGDEIEVYESESGLRGSGTVTEIDIRSGIVYLSVDWAALHESDDAAEPAIDHPQHSAFLVAIDQGPDVKILGSGATGAFILCYFRGSPWTNNSGLTWYSAGTRGL
jgi:hypothetical protein